jgi:fatty-acyl-CoA synthase
VSTVAELLAARAHDGNAAVRTTDDERWTWAEVVAASAARAGALRALLGDRQPPHVGVLLENVPEYVFVLGGAALAGAVVVGINPTRRGEELARDIRHTDCRLVLTDPERAPMLRDLDLGPSCTVLSVDEPEWLDEVDAAAGTGVPDRLPAADDLYLLLFTSGSTGAPKAVRVSQGRAARTAEASGVAFTADDILYCAMPLFHGNALLANLFPALVKGATVVLRRRFSATAFLPDVQRFGCTFFNYVGRALSYVLAQPESPEERHNQLKWGLGSEASPRDRKEFRRRFGCMIVEGYGSSENAVVIQPGPDTPPGALGRPKEGLDVAILDPVTSRECPPARFDDGGRLLNPGEAIGEIVGRNSLGSFEGYYANPEAEAERTRGGWYWTGDLGYRDEQGIFWFAGRNADWLRVDGENFSAAPVERILGRFPGVASVAVYAVPDPQTADQVMAAIEPDPRVEIDVDALAEFLDAQPDLGTKWAPRFVRIVEALPTTATRKVDKQPLRLARWETDDPVWWRPTKGEPYRRLTADDAAALRQAFADNGRLALLG